MEKASDFSGFQHKRYAVVITTGLAGGYDLTES